jgi:hypothetical protein
MTDIEQQIDAVRSTLKAARAEVIHMRSPLASIIAHEWRRAEDAGKSLDRATLPKDLWIINAELRVWIDELNDLINDTPMYARIVEIVVERSTPEQDAATPDIHANPDRLSAHTSSLEKGAA